MVTRALARLEHLWDGLLDRPADENALRLSALLLLLYSPDGGHFTILARILAIPMVLDGGAARSRLLWTLMTLDCLASTWVFRYSQDNHKYLLFYWTLACCLAVWTSAAPVLRRNARLLVALVFTFAATWKVMGGQVVNGDFFEWAFLTDSRFFSLIGLITGIESSDLALNESISKLLNSFPSEGLIGPLQTAPGVSEAGVALGWGMTLIEAAVALAFWAVLVRRFSDWQDWLLMLFCIGTYTLAPVPGFGTTLAVMGFAQVPDDGRELREVYLWTLIIVQFASLPSFTVIQQMLN